jgi:hypothetical protein
MAICPSNRRSCSISLALSTRAGRRPSRRVKMRLFPAEDSVRRITLLPGYAVASAPANSIATVMIWIIPTDSSFLTAFAQSSCSGRRLVPLAAGRRETQ